MTKAQGGVQLTPAPLTPFATPPIANIVASIAQVAALAAAGTPAPKGVLLVDPTTLLLYGQSDGAGGYVALGGGGGVISTYTAAQLAAMESAGTLTLNAWYVASDSGAWGLATAVNVIAWIDFDALALAMAEGLATDDADTISNKAGIPNIAALRALAETSALARTFHVLQSSATALRTGQIVCALATFATTFTITNPSGNVMRIAHATQAHGMGAASDGKYLWVKTSAGVPTGLYPITTRGTDPNQIEVDVGVANQSLIATTTVTQVSVLNSYFPAVVMPIPAGVMGPNGVATFHYAVEAQDTVTSTRYHKAQAGTAADGTGGAMIGIDGSITSTQAYGNNEVTGPTLINMNDVAVQRGLGAAIAGSDLPTSHTVNTDAAWYASLQIRILDIDTWMEILHFRVDIKPGL